MKSLHLGLTVLGAFFLSLSAAQAQAPVLDGVIGANEYGSSYVSGDQTWYMTWDNTNLYVATTKANTDEASILYLDTNPFTVANGGDNTLGTTSGIEYNNTNGTLPFRADAVVYIKASTDSSPDIRQNGGPIRRVTRKADPETGGWGSEVDIPAENVAINGGVREFSIPWSAISTTNARPANFNWFGYIANGRGYVYAQAPYFNPGVRPGEEAVIGNNAGFVRYFTTLNTAATGSTNNAFGPNNLDSYTHIGNSVGDFGAIEVYDFTLNSPNRSITRNSDINSTWTVRGNLQVANNSILNLGASVASVTVAGNVNALEESQFSFTNPSGGSLTVGGNLVFNNPARSTVDVPVALVGDGDRTISGDTYSKLTIDGAGTKTLTGGNLRIGTALILDRGILATGANTVLLGTTGQLSETDNGYLLGRVSALSFSPLSDVGASSDFGNIGLTLTQLQPQTAGNFANNVSVVRVTGAPGTLQGQSDAVRTISRRFAINASGTVPGNQTHNVSAAFAYRTTNPNELGGNKATDLELYKSESPANFAGTYTRVDGVTYNRTTPNVLRTDGPLQLNGSFYSLADGVTPLPVELISFTGKAENSAARLTWATASEKQNKGFEVERRTDQSEWQTLGFVAGNGTTNQRNNYTYVDRAPVAGNNYYRLRQIDVDGKSVYSDPLTVQVGAVEFTLSPVPATDVLTINGLSAGQHTAEIYNSRGQRVLSKEFTADAATTVAVSALPAGVYMVRVLGADRSTRNARFIKE